MKMKKLTMKIDLVILIQTLVILMAILISSSRNLSAETIPSFPAPTSVDTEKSPSKLNPIDSRMNDQGLNDPQALNAIRTLIQGGIPVGQSKTQIMNNVTPISQYSGSSMSNANPGLNAAYRYVVKKGDTLNKIIKSTFNQHPLKLQRIREVIITNNKKAFPTGKPSSMQAGATLVIPSLEQMGIQNTAESNGKANMIERQNPYISTDPHKGWVRFP